MWKGARCVVGSRQGETIEACCLKIKSLLPQDQADAAAGASPSQRATSREPKALGPDGMKRTAARLTHADCRGRQPDDTGSTPATPLPA